MAHTIEDTQDIEHIKHAFLPSKLEAMALVAGSFLFLLVINALPAIRTFDGVNYAIMTDYIKDLVEKILAPTNNQSASRILTVVLWMVIGMVVYIFVYIITNWLANYRRDVVETKGMILPAEFNKNTAWHETAFRIIVRLLATVALLYWIYLLLARILPYAGLLFLNSITELTLRSVASLALSVIILAVSVFIMFVFARCVVLRERVFNS